MDKYEIFVKGLKNEEALGGKFKISSKIMILAFLLVTALLSKKNEVNVGNIAWVNGNRGYEKLIPEDEGYAFFYHGTFFKKISNFRKFNSILSPYGFAERIKIILSAIREYPSKSHNRYLMSFWVEFYFIYELFKSSEIKKVITTGIYDRHTTWIAYICYQRKMKFEIIQHGVTSGVEPAIKIPCTKIVTFSEEEKRHLKTHVLLNKECEIEIAPFKSLLTFDNYPKNCPIIGIATQMNKDFIEMIVKELFKINKNFTIVLMLHPLEKKSKYRKISKFEKVIVEPTKKYINIDILITRSSTIVYDYLSNNYKGRIVQIETNNENTALYNIPGIARISKIDDIAKTINHLLIESEIER